MSERQQVFASAIPLESAGIVSLSIDAGPIGLKLLLSKDEALDLAREVNSAACQVAQAEGK